MSGRRRGDRGKVERRQEGNKKVRKGEVEGKWSEEIIKSGTQDGGWWEILELSEPTAEERSSKLSFICLCRVCAM